MPQNSQLKLTMAAISLTLLIASCASTSDQRPNKSENNDNYWYCAPGDQRTWRCAENKESLGLSYYRFWKTTPDLEAEQFEPDESEQSTDDLVMVQGIKVSAVEELSAEVTDETVAHLSYKNEEEDLEDELMKESIIKQETEQPATHTMAAYGKVLQLAAYHSQNQARSFADSLDEKLHKLPNLIRTRVNGQIYYTIVFDQLSSQQQAEQLITELAESFPSIQPWLRSRSGFQALRAD